MNLSHPQVSFYIALIVGYFAAHAAALLTKAHAPAWVLGAVTIVLTTLAGVLPTVAFNPGDSWGTYLTNVFSALVAATLAHRSQIPTALWGKTGGIVGPASPAPATTP